MFFCSCFLSQGSHSYIKAYSSFAGCILQLTDRTQKANQTQLLGQIQISPVL